MGVTRVTREQVDALNDVYAVPGDPRSKLLIRRPCVTDDGVGFKAAIPMEMAQPVQERLLGHIPQIGLVSGKVVVDKPDRVVSANQGVELTPEEAVRRYGKKIGR